LEGNNVVLGVYPGIPFQLRPIALISGQWKRKVGLAQRIEAFFLYGFFSLGKILGSEVNAFQNFGNMD